VYWTCGNGPVLALIRGMPQYEILGYRGYANESRAHVYGRVVEELGVSATGDRDSMFRNFLNTWRRADSDPLESASITTES
jgi:hypothetical protein